MGKGHPPNPAQARFVVGYTTAEGRKPKAKVFPFPFSRAPNSFALLRQKLAFVFNGLYKFRDVWSPLPPPVGPAPCRAAGPWRDP